MNLTKDFLLEEFTSSQTAARLGRRVIAEPPIVAALTQLCVKVLQPLRDAIGVTITVSSGYRPDWLNMLIGGSMRSQHMQGEAADIKAVGYSPINLCRKIIELDLPFDQLILEFNQWTHVSYKAEPRGSILTAKVVGGKTIYSKGLS